MRLARRKIEMAAPKSPTNLIEAVVFLIVRIYGNRAGRLTALLICVIFVGSGVLTGADAIASFYEKSAERSLENNPAETRHIEIYASFPNLNTSLRIAYSHCITSMSNRPCLLSISEESSYAHGAHAAPFEINKFLYIIPLAEPFEISSKPWDWEPRIPAPARFWKLEDPFIVYITFQDMLIPLTGTNERAGKAEQISWRINSVSIHFRSRSGAMNFIRAVERASLICKMRKLLALNG